MIIKRGLLLLRTKLYIGKFYTIEQTELNVFLIRFSSTGHGKRVGMVNQLVLPPAIDGDYHVFYDKKYIKLRKNVNDTKLNP